MFLAALVLHPIGAVAGAPGAAAGESLRLTVSARSAALGGTGVGAGAGAGSIEGNPAGLAWLRRPEGVAAHAEWPGGVRFESLAGAAPLGGGRLGALGGQINVLHVSDLPRTDADGIQNGTFAFRDVAVRAAYGRLIGETLSAGGSLTFLSEMIDDAGGAAVALDVGFQSRPRSWVVLGAALQNAGTPLSVGGAGYPLPITLREGVTVKIHKRRAMRDVVLIHLEGTQAAFGASDVRGGVEVWPVRRLALRLGYRTRFASHPLGASVGLTGGLGVSPVPHWVFDYAFVPFGFGGGLGSAHRVSLGYRFGPEPVLVAAAPDALWKAARRAATAGTGDALVRASAPGAPDWVAHRPGPDGVFMYFTALASGASTPAMARDEAVHDLATQIVEYSGVGVRSVYDSMQRAVEREFLEDLRVAGPASAGRYIRDRYDEEWLHEGGRRFTIALLAAYPHSALDWTRSVSGGTQTVAVMALTGREVDATILDTVTEQLQVAVASPPVAGRTVLETSETARRLAAVPTGWVATPDTVITKVYARRAAQALAASHLVVGSMRRSGSGYAMDVRLFDAARDRWAGRWSARVSPASDLASSALGGRIRDRLDRP